MVEGCYNANTIARHYREKYIIECAFRFLKSFLDLRPIYVRIDEHVRTHIDICMAGYSINKHIRDCLEKINVGLQEFYDLINKYSVATTIGAGDDRQVTILQRPSQKLITMLNSAFVKYILRMPINRGRE
ncbi:MAG: hypothetical protein HQK49_22865 [Oligoflexia bacterium]|nr:hypothetical protein [Oligoflexia bacterium]